MTPDPFLQALFGAGWTQTSTQSQFGQYFQQSQFGQAYHRAQYRQMDRPHGGARGAPKPFQVEDSLATAIAAGKIPPKSVAQGTYDQFLQAFHHGPRGEPIRLVTYTINDDPDEP